MVLAVGMVRITSLAHNLQSRYRSQLMSLAGTNYFAFSVQNNKGVINGEIIVFSDFPGKLVQ